MIAAFLFGPWKPGKVCYLAGFSLRDFSGDLRTLILSLVILEKRTGWCSGKGGGGPEAALFFGTSLLLFLERARVSAAHS